MIQASIHGRAGIDPVTTETKNGIPMTRLNIAVDVTGYGAEEPETLWVSVLGFGNVSEALERASKGETLTAMGKLTRGRYRTADGQERESWSLLADAVLTAKSARPSGRRRASSPPPSSTSWE